MKLGCTSIATLRMHIKQPDLEFIQAAEMMILNHFLSEVQGAYRRIFGAKAGEQPLTLGASCHQEALALTCDNKQAVGAAVDVLRDCLRLGTESGRCGFTFLVCR